MIRLAIETATPSGSVAVGQGERILAEVELGEQAGHADAMVPALDAVLDLAGIGRADIAAIVVGAGPGSFTGVRVAAATAKGLAAALDVSLAAYPSLLSLAAGIPSTGPVCALFDARRGEVYGGCWRVDTDVIEAILEPTVGPVEAVAAAVVSRVEGSRPGRTPAEAGRPTPVLFVGDGARRYRETLVSLVPRGDVDPGGADPVHPRAGTLLWLAEHHPVVGRVPDRAGWEPSYVRGSSAERRVPG